MMVICDGRKKRGVIVPNPEELKKKMSDAGCGWLEVHILDCAGVTVLRIDHASTVSAAAAAFKWLAQGRGYKKYNAVEVPTVAPLAGFTSGECKAAFVASTAVPDKHRQKKTLGLFDRSKGYLRVFPGCR